MEHITKKDMEVALRKLILEQKIDIRWDPEVEDFRFYPMPEDNSQAKSVDYHLPS